jgi:hypothetical protein
MSSKFSECAGMEVMIGSEKDQLGDCLGEGAEGAVYELGRFDDIVAKIIKEEKREQKEPKIETMVQQSMISPEDQTEIPWTTWPVDPVSRHSDGSFLGYAMPYLDTDQYIDAQKYASQNLRWEETSPPQVYKPAINLVLTVTWLHQNGYAIGDLSEQNIRVNDGNVTLIDCDSYSIEGQDFVGQMEAPRYTPPEGRGTTHEEIKKTDQFGVAVHIFQFLMAGFHPYQAVGEDAVDGPLHEAIQKGTFPYGDSNMQDIAPPPHAPDFTKLPKSLRRGFEQCFSAGQSNPNARPSLEKWLATLSEEGNFEIEGINTSNVISETKDQEKLGSNWQEEIRQNNNRTRTGGTTKPDASKTTTTTTSNSDTDSHWADNLRDDQTARSDSKPRRQPSSTPSSHQSSDYDKQTIIATALVFVFLLLIILLYL